jgi:hypothetical protein
MRFSGDDYCYGGVLTKHGFFKGQAYAYLNQVPFHGNRYSLTFFAFFFSLFHPVINGLLPAAAILLWSIGLTLVIQKITSLTETGMLRYEILLTTGFLVFVSLYTAPDLPESLYWRSAMLPYLAPVIANLFLILTILNLQEESKRSKAALIAPLVLSVLAGGFSEAVAAIQVGYLAVWIIIATIGDRVLHREQSQSITPRIVALSGSLIAGVVLLISPSTMSEVASSGFLDDFLHNAILSIRYSNDFIIDSFKSLPLPHVITLILFAVLSMLISSRATEENSQPKKLVILMLAAIAMCYLLISLGIAPSVFVRGVYPNPRALIAARFILMATVAIVGWMWGQGISEYLRKHSTMERYFSVIVAVMLLGVSLYSLRVANQTFRSASKYQIWASQWDARDAQIRDDLARGVRDLEVVRIEKIFQWVADLSPDPTTWYNACAAEYYGAKAISASLSAIDDQ